MMNTDHDGFVAGLNQTDKHDEEIRQFSRNFFRIQCRKEIAILESWKKDFEREIV